jgi:hypothetical protein
VDVLTFDTTPQFEDRSVTVKTPITYVEQNIIFFDHRIDTFYDTIVHCFFGIKVSAP